MAKPDDLQLIAAEAVEFLSGLPGVEGAKPLPRSVIDQIVEEEERYEISALAPTRCIGVRIAAARQTVIGVIKDRKFRDAPKPTVYMVEERPAVDESEENYFTLEGKTYLIVGEEVFASRLPYMEKTVPMGDSFVIFPNRVSGSGTPAFFMIPPLGVPELEENGDKLGIHRVISVSPSPPADSRLREYCSFPPDASMATLLVAFDMRQERYSAGQSPS